MNLLRQQRRHPGADLQNSVNMLNLGPPSLPLLDAPSAYTIRTHAQGVQKIIIETWLFPKANLPRDRLSPRDMHCSYGKSNAVLKKGGKIFRLLLSKNNHMWRGGLLLSSVNLGPARGAVHLRKNTCHQLYWYKQITFDIFIGMNVLLMQSSLIMVSVFMVSFVDAV